MTNMAKCHLLMGHWVDALKAAEIVMARDRKNIQAIEVKAESLYNSCYFEHALVLFHRGRVCYVLFILGILAILTYTTKCSKTEKIMLWELFMPKIIKIFLQILLSISTFYLLLNMALFDILAYLLCICSKCLE